MLLSVIATLTINLAVLLMLFLLITFLIYKMRWIRNQWIILAISSASSVIMTLALGIRFISNFS